MWASLADRRFTVDFPMAAKARITLAIALGIAAIAVMGRAVPWIAVPLILLAVFFIFWGTEQRPTERFIQQLPLGPHILKILDAVDSAVTPRDREYERDVRSIITGYDASERAALRLLYQTRNTNRVPAFENKFKADGFIEYPKDGPGWIKPEARDVVGRTLDELGV
jgi:hypothetical protein